MSDWDEPGEGIEEFSPGVWVRPGLRSGRRAPRRDGLAITVVAGPPGARKTTWVQAQARRGDLIVDLDALAAALSGLPWHDKPPAILPFAWAAWRAVLAQLERSCPVQRAWVVTATPEMAQLRRLRRRLGARLHVVRATRAECLARIAAQGRPERPGGWAPVVSDWFDRADFSEETEADG